jgi:transforming growth factor-beta-induced protein
VPLPTQTLWQLIQADPQLSTLAGAIQTRPELVNLLGGSGPITLFLPTNAALSALPEWSGIAADDARFAMFLLGHAVEGSLDSAQVLASSELTTMSDEKLVIDRLAGTINGARFVTLDTQATNGYLHTVDGALVVPAPPATTAAPAAEAPPTSTP